MIVEKTVIVELGESRPRYLNGRKVPNDPLLLEIQTESQWSAESWDIWMADTKFTVYEVYEDLILANLSYLAKQKDVLLVIPEPLPWTRNQIEADIVSPKLLLDKWIFFGGNCSV